MMPPGMSHLLPIGGMPGAGGGNDNISLLALPPPIAGPMPGQLALPGPGGSFAKPPAPRYPPPPGYAKALPPPQDLLPPIYFGRAGLPELPALPSFSPQPKAAPQALAGMKPITPRSNKPPAPPPALMPPKPGTPPGSSDGRGPPGAPGAFEGHHQARAGGNARAFEGSGMQPPPPPPAVGPPKRGGKMPPPGAPLPSTMGGGGTDYDPAGGFPRGPPPPFFEGTHQTSARSSSSSGESETSSLPASPSGSERSERGIGGTSASSGGINSEGAGGGPFSRRGPPATTPFAVRASSSTAPVPPDSLAQPVVPKAGSQHFALAKEGGHAMMPPPRSPPQSDGRDRPPPPPMPRPPTLNLASTASVSRGFEPKTPTMPPPSGANFMPGTPTGVPPVIPFGTMRPDTLIQRGQPPAFQPPPFKMPPPTGMPRFPGAPPPGSGMELALLGGPLPPGSFAGPPMGMMGGPPTMGSGPISPGVPLPPPPPREDDSAFVRRVRLIYMDRVMREHQKQDLLEMDPVGRPIPAWVFNLSAVMPYISVAAFLMAAIVVILVYSLKFDSWQEKHW